VRSEEVVFELSYQAQLAPWWIIQPDVQYIVHPGGHTAGSNPTVAIKHAAIIGVRSTIKF
jgi:porin